MNEIFVADAAEQEAGLLHLRPWTSRYPWLAAGFTTRRGGVSGEPLDALNCAMHVGDADRNVVENRGRVARALGFSLDDWTCAEQVHGCRVGVMADGDRGRGSRARASAVPGTDALITDRPGMLLTAVFADCVPLFFFDPIHRAIGLAHAGWRGTAQNIAGATVRAMHQAFASRADQLLAAIGPSIGECCYEVDDAVLQRMLEAYRSHGMPAEEAARLEQENAIHRPESGGKCMLNLKEANRQFMIMAGILPTHIELSQWCTSCDTGLFFSHRKEFGHTGRMAAWIGLKGSLRI